MATHTATKAKKQPTMPKGLVAPVYDRNGKDAGSVSLPESIFNVTLNANMLHQVVQSMANNARVPVADAKDRGEQRGGGKKPWRQKGTGRARHGSRRSPIWRGGGVTHGPTSEKIFARKVNKKMRTKALFMALSEKLRAGGMLMVKGVAFDTPSAKEARNILSTLGSLSGYERLLGRTKNVALIAIPEQDASFKRSFQNFGNIAVDEVRNLNPLDVLTYKYVIVIDPERSVKMLESRIAKKS